jgi:glutamine cyclotransferase
MIAGLALLGWTALRPSSSSKQTVVLAEMAAIAPPSPDAPDDFPAIVDSAVRDQSERLTPAGATFEIIETIPHDTNAFTQGLEIHDGRLFESTGLTGQSSIRELDLSTGDTLRILPVADVFAEGLTIIGDTTVQITWRNGEAYRYDTDTFTRTDTYTYDGEGWGICDDGDRLIMSDGSPTLQFRDPINFDLLGTVEVRYGNTPVDELNELECVGGNVWANIWKSSLIIEIDPETGNVVTVLNARPLTPPSVEGSSSDVLNGIAYDPADGTFLLTGKRWPTIYRVRIDRLVQ